MSSTPSDLLRRVLEPLGLWNADGISRRARARHCRKCGALVMAGLDADVLAAPVLCDIQPLTPLGEIAALFEGIRTVSITWEGNRFVIDDRDQWRIAGKPAGTAPNSDVVTEHVCGRTVPHEMRAPSNAITAHTTTPSKGTDDTPPF
jgi:hypothetical protein